jgi:quercetin 2,3-dioxygenase
MVAVVSAILETFPLGFPWATMDPFLFCVHHDDNYPPGNDELGPAASLAGRDLGMDFTVRSDTPGEPGWRMYHGDKVPGFPGHPHRGFETVTIVRRGLIDHSDSLGAAARFGGGDVQWLTAGKGIVHSEMFPLLDKGARNPLELFQIWLNLPAANKMVEPHFSMLWAKDIPVIREHGAEVTVVAGSIADSKALPPPPKSWASQANADVAIWTIKLAPGATWTLPKTNDESNRVLYVFAGAMRVEDRAIKSPTGVALDASQAVGLTNTGDTLAEALVLQGRPIGEPVVQHGPFVMTTRQEIQQAFADYQRTRFGGWPWPSEAPTHPREEGRFARHADGRVEKVPS